MSQLEKMTTEEKLEWLRSELYQSIKREEQLYNEVLRLRDELRTVRGCISSYYDKLRSQNKWKKRVG